MAPELTLGVGLDLKYFRQQMRKAVNIAQSEFTAQLNVRINRQIINNEIRNLDRALKHKKFYIELNVAGGLDKDKFEAIQSRLDTLASRKAIELPISIRAAATQRDITSAVANLNRRIRGSNVLGRTGGKIRVPTSIRAAITQADIRDFKKEVASKLSGIKVKVKAEVGEVSRGAAFAAGPSGFAGLQEFMRTQGMSGGNMPGQTPVGMGRRAQFENAVEQATAKELERMLRTAEVAGRSKLKTKAAMQAKLLELNDIAMESILGNLKMQMQQPRKIKRSFLDQIARTVMYMAGIDPEVLRQQAAARRLPPAIDFPATVPTRSVSIGPSSTGRALSGVTQQALPGRSIADAKYLPSDLGVELKRILRDAAYAFIDSLNSRIRQVRVSEIGQARLAPARVAGLLPSAVGRTPARYGGAGDTVSSRIQQAYARSAARAASVMAEGPRGFALGAGGSGSAGPYRQYAQPPAGGAIVPYQAPSPLPPRGGARGGIGQMVGQLKNIGPLLAPLQQSRLPLTGAVSELTGEFGNAIKQVLLFGTAYKALAFIIDLPAQALDAATSLQSFNNQVNAITGSTANANSAIDFINQSVDQFKIPLQSARDGFLRLYASMSPAGISVETIQGLFTGVSQAAATLSLTPDQVDRVTHAFSQMASKGKLMAEEVTGQLGDVIPGALSLMADAAGMSIADFKQAMEDGQLSGKAMEQVFSNLGIVFDERFGKGAAGAADTLRGRLSDLQTSVTQMYEAFEPLVELVAANALPGLSVVIKDATDAIKAFSMNAAGAGPATGLLSNNAKSLYDTMVQLQGVLQSIQKFISSLSGVFGLLGSTLSVLLQAVNAFISNPVGQFIAKLTTLVLAANAALAILAPRFIAVAQALKLLNISLLTGSQRFGAIRAQMKTTGATATVLRGQITGVGVGLKAVFAGTGLGLILLGLTELAAHMQRTADRAKEIRLNALNAADAIRVMSKTEAIQKERQTQATIRTLEGIQGRKAPYEAASGEEVGIPVSAEEVKDLERGGIPVKRVGFRGERGTIMKSDIPGLIQQQQGILAGTRNRQTLLDYESKQQREAATITPVDLSAGEGDGKGRKGKELQDYDRDLKEFYENQFKIKSLAIEQDISLTARQKEIGVARERYRADELIALEQYNRELGKLQKIKPEQRELARVDEEVKKQKRLQIAAAQYSNTLLRPIIKAAEDEASTKEGLAQKIRLLKKGREELTAVERIEYAVKKTFEGVDEKAIAQMQGKIDAVRKEAAEVDKLTAEYNRLDEAKKAAEGFQRTETSLQNRLSMARAITPGQEIRERYRQEDRTPEQVEQLAQLEELAIKAEEIKAIYQDVAQTIGSAFGQAFQDVVNGSKSMQEALSDMLQSIGQSFVAMAAQIIAKQVVMITLQAILTALGGPSFSGGAGIGESVKMPTGVGMGAGGGIIQNPQGQGFGTLGPNFGIRQFADGGVVKGPTLGLVGEGRYNEAIVPLPDGRSIPVRMQGASLSRQLLSEREARQNNSPNILSMSFETTNINGVEYVSRDQLEQAMASTRKAAARDGAAQGSRLTLDKLRNSPTTRRQIGIS